MKSSKSAVVDEVLSRYGNYPVALTGCRATDQALSCCEYDFVIIADGKDNELLKVNEDYAEIHVLSPTTDPFRISLSLHRMQVINDPSWALSTLKQQVEEVRPKALAWYSRRKAVDALFYANRSVEAAKHDAVISSLWLKCATYYYLEAAIARMGEMPMPAHMLAQLRSIEDKTLAEGIDLAASCLALERANKSSVSRCMEASIGLNKKLIGDYTTSLVTRKASFLYDSGMYADCYLYLGHTARDAIAGIVADPRALKDYTLMISIAMDLTSDQWLALKLSPQLLGACNALLKIG